MSVASKKRRLARRADIRADKPVPDAQMMDLFSKMDQITEKAIKGEQKVVKIFLSMKEWLQVNRNKKNQKKVFRADRREHKIALERAKEAVKRAENRAKQELKLAKKLARKSK